MGAHSSHAVDGIASADREHKNRHSPPSAQPSIRYAACARVEGPGNDRCPVGLDLDLRRVRRPERVLLAVQLRACPHLAGIYRLAIAMAGVFGTMAADVPHTGLGAPLSSRAPRSQRRCASSAPTIVRTPQVLSVGRVARRRSPEDGSSSVLSGADGTLVIDTHLSAAR